MLSAGMTKENKLYTKIWYSKFIIVIRIQNSYSHITINWINRDKKKLERDRDGEILASTDKYNKFSEQRKETITDNWFTCIIETNEIADPVSDGGFDNMDFGFAEYAEGEAERTFNTYIWHTTI